MTVLLPQLLVGEFSQTLPKWSQILFFGCNFFRVENRENFLLSTFRNMMFPQILSYIPLLYDQWSASTVLEYSVTASDYRDL